MKLKHFLYKSCIYFHNLKYSQDYFQLIILFQYIIAGVMSFKTLANSIFFYYIFKNNLFLRMPALTYSLYSSQLILYHSKNVRTFNKNIHLLRIYALVVQLSISDFSKNKFKHCKLMAKNLLKLQYRISSRYAFLRKVLSCIHSFIV